MIIPVKLNFDPKAHLYYSDTGQVYKGTSKFVGSFSEPFNPDIAIYVAKKRKSVVEKMAKKTGRDERSILMGFEKYSRGITSEDVAAEWEAKKNEAADAGTYIHNAVEAYLKFGTIEDPKMEPICKYVLSLLTGYNEFQSEAMVCNEDLARAGTCDIIGKRTSAKNSVVDIFDMKTNWDGFSYDSMGLDQYTGEVKHYNRYFHDPISHLEDCYYNKTCLQMSDYMWMAENYGYKPGKLNVILIDWKLRHEPKLIPIPYMKHEIESMINHKR